MRKPRCLSSGAEYHVVARINRGEFTKHFNNHFNLHGHVWYDRFKSTIIESFQQLIATFRYICNNPVKAEIIENPEEYLFGALWFIHHRQFNLIEPPDPYILTELPDLFEQLLNTV